MPTGLAAFPGRYVTQFLVALVVSHIMYLDEKVSLVKSSNMAAHFFSGFFA
jgi:hypothetical protein